MSQRYFIFPTLCITLIFLFLHANAATLRYDSSFEEPLVIAADRSNIHEITRLLKNGAKVNKQDKFGVTPLMRAVVRGNSEVVKVLLDAGADVHIKDIGGATALHIASRLGYKTISDMLLKNGANPNALDTQGYTPLERAIKSEHEGIVQTLISEGANLTRKGPNGLTPSELAFQGNNKKIQQIFNNATPVAVAKTPNVVTTVLTDEPIKQEAKDADSLVVKTEKKASDSVVTTSTVVSIVHTDNLKEQNKKPVNILGALKTNETTEDKADTPKKSNPDTALPEQETVPHIEPIAPEVEENAADNIASPLPLSENEPINEQAFDIIAWFNNTEPPLTDTPHNDTLEKEVAYTIAEDDQFIGPELATNSIPVIEPEQDIITQEILAPIIVMPTPLPKPENAMPVAGNKVTIPIKDPKERPATIKSPKNKELIVHARKVPDTFQTTPAHNTMNTGSDTSFHLY